MSVSVNVREELYRQASEIALAENISFDDVFGLASYLARSVLSGHRRKGKESR